MRSQLKNKEKAMAVLRSRLLAQEVERQQAEIRRTEVAAQVLLRNTLGIDRATFHASPDRELSHEDAEAFHGTLERRIEGEPLSYITGHREFYGLDFVVTPDVLVPRQETEFLVEAVLGYARSRGRDGGDLTIADIGTGSGAVAVALGCHLPNAVVYERQDVSRRGYVRVARREVAEHGHGRSSPPAATRDLFEALDGPVDVVVSNPPYLSDDEVAELPPDVSAQPTLPLAAGRPGRDDACCAG
ncbi:Release factor glutamine methyltransferase [Geodia barretti]|uniref:peptide chain release factor N(5)-glutamine methyltransferase n=1 Tax=Geodia barretti TaxID=519541 RepID=A0AA35W7R4_GEOBA|nr:Release factor glutamine methyltransferase [Geodia barretti]